MRAGLLNEIICIEAQTYETTEYGDQNTVVWTPKIPSTRAAVVWKNVGRVNENGELFYAKSIEFQIRKYHDVSNLDRIIWRGEKYRIISIEYDRQSQRKIITCDLINE